MTFAAVTLLGMTMGQPAAQPLTPDYYPMHSRTIKLPIEYKKDKKTIRHVLLCVARNGENTWYQEALVTPDKDSFVYVAKEDGIYWFKMQIVDLQGKKDPAELTQDPPDLKMVIDTTPPQVRVTNAKRNGEDIVIEWSVEDKFPNDAETKVHFRPMGDTRALWQEVALPANSRTGVRFPSGTTDGITVRITAVDIAGNRTEVTRDYPGANAGANAGQTTVLSPPNITTPPAPPKTDLGMPGGVIAPPPNFDPPSGPGPISPPVGPVGPGPGVVSPPLPKNPVYNPQDNPPPFPSGNTNPGVVSGASGTGGTGVDLKPIATYDPKAPPPAPPAVTPPGGNQPAGWPGPAPTVEVSRAQVVNYSRFDLGYDLEKNGPSGISRVDLWVTRDEGKSWRKWSQHDGKGGAVRVTLDVPGNTQLEGNYGFRLVPVSGAGLSEREPVAGDTPDMRMVLDVTAPQIELFKPKSDPNNPDTLLILWRASDKNFGDNPITLEWSEHATGPWHPIASDGNAPVVQATATPPVARRLANTGQYGWRVPAGTPAHVYLKVTARDAAGNVREVVTRDPEAVDLTTPRAKINGIVQPPVTPRP